jgi:hypothetical protein
MSERCDSHRNLPTMKLIGETGTPGIRARQAAERKKLL